MLPDSHNPLHAPEGEPSALWDTETCNFTLKHQFYSATPEQCQGLLWECFCIVEIEEPLDLQHANGYAVTMHTDMTCLRLMSTSRLSTCHPTDLASCSFMHLSYSAATYPDNMKAQPQLVADNKNINKTLSTHTGLHCRGQKDSVYPLACWACCPSEALGMAHRLCSASACGHPANFRLQQHATLLKQTVCTLPAYMCADYTQLLNRLRAPCKLPPATTCKALKQIMCSSEIGMCGQDASLAPAGLSFPKSVWQASVFAVF